MDTLQTPPTKLDPVRRSSKVVLIVLGVIFLCVASAVAGYFFYGAFRGSDVVDSTSSPTPSASGESEVRWTEPSDMGNLDALFTSSEGTLGDKYYLVGTIISGKYKDGNVMVMLGGCYGMCFSQNIYRIIRKTTMDGVQTFLLKKQSDSLGDGQYVKLKSEVVVDTEYELPGLAFPDEIRGPKTRQILKRDIIYRGMFNLLVTNSEKAFGIPQGDVFISKIQDTATMNGFYMRASDGTQVTYKLVVDFVGDDRVPQVTWNDGSHNVDQYEYTDLTGCGSSNYASVVTGLVNQTNDLVSAGTNSRGDTIYTLKDTDNKLLRDDYDEKYLKDRFSYDEYIKARPMFFWIDPFQRVIKFENAKFVPAAECGKPVIYLYPEHTTQVSVQLEPQGGFSFTEPAYDGGWSVIADSNGNLTETKSGKVYPYLFWEGRGGIYDRPKRGFVVTQGDVHAFLIRSLAQLGLNSKETADFIEFWEPRMKQAPYYFVSFLGTQAMNALAPMKITPEPDTVIRILMDFYPLEKSIKVEPVHLKSIPRKGFTVIEWGGVIR
ncbi:MAG: hypothetical protein AAB479_03170 [Patescibacteria group bacterium]